MAQLKRVARPFGEVNVEPLKRDHRRKVRATVPLGVEREGSQTGVALDASGSMSANYADPMGTGSVLRPVAQNLCTFLAGKVDADGGTTAVYWALGTAGEKVEVIGDLTAEQAKTHPFPQPARLGGGTQLLPVVRYFAERFIDAPWGIYAILTDGEFSDLAEVKAYSLALAKGIKAGTRKPLKFVLIGVGDGVNEKQMEALDDLTEGTDLPDLWDHKVAAEMRSVSDIFAEVVTENARVAKTGKVLAPDGTTLKDYSDTGVPGVIQFDAPAGVAYFTLVADGKRFHQALSDEDGLNVPVSDAVPGTESPIAGVAPGTQFAKTITPLTGAAESGGGAKGAQASAQTGAQAGARPGEITDFDVSGLGRDAATVGISTDPGAPPAIDLKPEPK